METPSFENPIRTSVAQQRRPLPALPPDLIAEILTWLPVVSLLRFRCVSKWFKTLISSPDFVKAHLRSMKALSTIKPNRVDRAFRRSLNFVQRLIKPERRFSGDYIHRQNKPSPPVVDWGSHSWSLESLFNGPRIEVSQRVNVCEGVDNGGDWVAGSCDGLICSVLGLYHGVVVWNPSTRVMRELPDFDYEISESQMRRCDKVFGFGYDRQLDDYKVVVVISYPSEDPNRAEEFETQVQVFALRTTSWRRIEDFKYGVPSDAEVKFAAGCLYYKVPSFQGEGKEWRDTLVSLDLATEKYNKVKLPAFDDAGTHWELASFVDRLCVACFDDDDSCEVWVMKEPGVTDAWTKLFRVDQVVVDAGLHAPLYISDNGEVLWDNDEDLFIYNSKDNTIRFPTSRGLSNRDGPPVIYMETLASPNIDH
ncbi:unnamed protein product [Linum trigynum]|uniref:F-box domain-containing protein n=1 Tax=Linum trigynum TaxID=586398 RepID=A0AAV2D3N0_9ROSI